MKFIQKQRSILDSYYAGLKEAGEVNENNPLSMMIHHPGYPTLKKLIENSEDETIQDSDILAVKEYFEMMSGEELEFRPLSEIRGKLGQAARAFSVFTWSNSLNGYLTYVFNPIDAMMSYRIQHLSKDYSDYSVFQEYFEGEVEPCDLFQFLSGISNPEQVKRHVKNIPCPESIQSELLKYLDEGDKEAFCSIIVNEHADISSFKGFIIETEVKGALSDMRQAKGSNIFELSDNANVSINEYFSLMDIFGQAFHDMCVDDDEMQEVAQDFDKDMAFLKNARIKMQEMEMSGLDGIENLSQLIEPFVDGLVRHYQKTQEEISKMSQQEREIFGEVFKRPEGQDVLLEILKHINGVDTESKPVVEETVPDTKIESQVEHEMGDKISMKEFADLPIAEEQFYFNKSCVSQFQVSNPNLAFEKYSELYGKITSIEEGCVKILEDTADNFNLLLFRLTGRYREIIDLEKIGLLKFNAPRSQVLYFTRMTNLPKEGTNIPSHTYEKAFQFYDWIGGNHQWPKNNAQVRKEANNSDNIIPIDYIKVLEYLAPGPK